MAPRRKTTLTIAHDAPKMPEREFDDAGEVEYFKDYRPPTTSQKQLMLSPQWRDRELPIEVAYFRAEQMQHLDGSPQAKYWRVLKADAKLPAEVVTKHPELAESTYKDFFVSSDEPGYPFDGMGLIPYGNFVRVEDRECREQYLAVRPIGAKLREQQMRANFSSQWEAPPSDAKMDVTDPQTGEKLLKSETFNPAKAEGDPRIVTSGSLPPMSGWANPAVR